MLLPQVTGNSRIPQALSFAVFCEVALVVSAILGSAGDIPGPGDAGGARGTDDRHGIVTRRR
jgi:hypothetical protein